MEEVFCEIWKKTYLIDLGAFLPHPLFFPLSMKWRGGLKGERCIGSIIFGKKSRTVFHPYELKKNQK